MEHQNLEKLFAKLAARLHTFESKEYLVCKDDPNAPWEPVHNFPIIDEITKHIYGFEAQSALPFVTYYEERVQHALKALEPVKYYLSDKEYGVIMETPINKEWQGYLMNDYNKELKTYLTNLKNYKQVFSTQIKSININDKQELNTQITYQNLVNLPENFTISHLKKTVPTFTPLLEIKETAYFLHYLRKMKIIVPYNGKSLTIFGKAFLARNEQNIKEVLAEIGYDKFEREKLENLKSVIEKLLEEINKDLK